MRINSYTQWICKIAEPKPKQGQKGSDGFVLIFLVYNNIWLLMKSKLHCKYCVLDIVKH